MAKSDLIAQSIAHLALKAHCARHADRSIVDSGKTYDKVKLKVTGTVGRKPVEIDLAGKLKIGDDNPVGSTRKPAADKLLAEVLARLPKTRLKQLAADVESGITLDPPPETLAIARAMIDRLSTKAPRAGSVSFISK